MKPKKKILSLNNNNNTNNNSNDTTDNDNNDNNTNDDEMMELELVNRLSILHNQLNKLIHQRQQKQKRKIDSNNQEQPVSKRPTTRAMKLEQNNKDNNSRNNNNNNSTNNSPSTPSKSPLINGNNNNNNATTNNNNLLFPYQLHSIVQHRGSVAYAGHYVCDIIDRSMNGGSRWKRYDDQFVREIPESTAIGQGEREGYIFFYHYCGNTKFTQHSLSPKKK